MSITNRRNFIKTSALTAGAALLTQTDAVAMKPIPHPFGSKMKLSCAAYGYRKYLKEQNPPTMTIMDFLDECAKMGLGAAEPTSYYFPSPLTEEYLLQFKRKAHLLGLDISGTAIGNTFTYAPGPKRDEQLALTKQWVDYAAIMGAPCIRIFAGTLQKGDTMEQAIQYCIDTTKEACAYAATKGVFLALENHGGIVAEPDPLIRIVEAVESDWIGVNFDSGNFQTEDPYADMAKIAPYTVNAQVKVEIKPKGQDKTEADLERIINILGESGYRGYVALEYESDQEPKEDIPRYIEKLQEILGRA